MEISKLAKKLLIKENYKVCVLEAPEGYTDLLEPLPEGVTVDKALEQEYEFLHVFVKWQEEVVRIAPLIRKHLKKDGILWLSYPKGTSKVATDINRDKGWEALHAEGLQGVSLISVNEIWSAMRFRPVKG